MKNAQVVAMFKKAVTMLNEATTVRQYNRAKRTMARLPAPEQFVLIDTMIAALKRVDPRRFASTRNSRLTLRAV